MSNRNIQHPRNNDINNTGNVDLVALFPNATAIEEILIDKLGLKMKELPLAIRGVMSMYVEASANTIRGNKTKLQQAFSEILGSKGYQIDPVAANDELFHTPKNLPDTLTASNDDNYSQAA